ncbi:MAG: phosphoribosylformylglycinamidine synthase [Muricauda sp.]|jgi:phosphoribosylformylglycinamidine synthase|nr:phosphoribosylformylglycinamidine synthase [Allomuricauda sp.]MBO6532746.1 phosphoribosylformylglycinamidine synthase [Allomuricauda sp.]MBO6588973.1 phosphoribosylformylglycinamidine synthase [Allomuricauda sp.]MBO6618598.1 phosphoribosylformylglycinamidine synthase [Allomuricauda sp.]MBO6644511.1 phosphoribosylformylglycinamidine synthase [Allomuricauda sp.]MBO6746411.1 phosphoribosylformylglycinamidine synthase [Allomuricauda sp.]
MIHFFGDKATKVFAVQTAQEITQEDTNKLTWLFGNQPKIEAASLDAFFVGPRAAMVTPWSTNATEITQNMGISGIIRIEEFRAVSVDYTDFDPMLSQKYASLGQDIFTINIVPEPIMEIDDIAAYNEKEGLALSEEEVAYLEGLAKKLGRKLTDSEVFGFSQVNSEHCRHKIFNGTFVIDGVEKPSSLFKLIKKTSEANPNDIVSAYKDNVAFIKGPKAIQFAPKSADKPDFYEEKEFDSVLSLKAETHNFPTTVEPFNGAATGSGGEIRDRLAGGKGSLPLAGTAVYMTSYSRLEENRPWEKGMKERDWLYQTPMDILIKASNGASDFGNKFGQPLIAGSVLTFEYDESKDISTALDMTPRKLGFDKVIMMAGGIGYGKTDQALKDTPSKGDRIVVLGGDNYRIGMGGAAVSSADTGEFSSAIELNAVQRSNPEMQKRASNAVRGLFESHDNPIVSIHDHGAGGHLNCLSELVEETGGTIDTDKLPVGDPTLSKKELIGNESQERMGLVIGEKDLDLLDRISARERSPMYNVGEVTGDHTFKFTSGTTGETPMNLELSDMFGSSPKTIMADKTSQQKYPALAYSLEHFHEYLEQVLQLEAVACKDWLTNKVDRCVGGRVAKQQCAGPLQLPLNNCGVMALDFKGKEGIATSIGHSPISALIDPVAGSRNSVAESLTNIVWAPLQNGLTSVSLSANWMWPCRNEGEDARLYAAVESLSQFAIDLGINVPTGKDSLSMKQKYKDGEVLSPGTVIISAAAHCNNINQVVEPVLQKNGGDIYYINLSKDSHKLGGSSFSQILNGIGDEAPSVLDADYFKNAFNTLQKLIKNGQVLAGHDVASGGLITTLLELCFADTDLGADLDLSSLGEADIIKLLFSENSGVVFQAKDASVEDELKASGIEFTKIGTPTSESTLNIKNNGVEIGLNIASLRDTWFKTSYLLDNKQTANGLAKDRYDNYKEQPLQYVFPKDFDGRLPMTSTTLSHRPKAAILREKGSNSEREMANAMYLAGFDVKDVHMTDLITGRETLEDIQFIGAVGGFSNSDVLGSAKGWAGAFKYNEKANKALKDFFARPDTLSVGICNGCQLFMELDLINPEHGTHGRMTYNDSHKHESNFTSVKIQENNSVMLSNLTGTTLGVWISHGEGKFSLPHAEDQYHIVAKYGYEGYPANPNGSDYNTAMLCDKTGRHLVTMPHIERSTFPWNWAYYPKDRTDVVSPWLQAFVNARVWLESLED